MRLTCMRSPRMMTCCTCCSPPLSAPRSQPPPMKRRHDSLSCDKCDKFHGACSHHGAGVPGQFDMYRRLSRATLVDVCHPLCDPVPDPSAPCMSGHPGNMHRALWTTANSSKHADSCAVCVVLCLGGDFQCTLHKQAHSSRVSKTTLCA